LVNLTYITAQEIVIKGTVTDAATGETLPGVNIIEKGTQRGATTNQDGSYSITVSNSDAVLVFSFVGYLSEEVDVAGRAAINLTLVESIEALDEIVVIGYGSVKKRELTGSVASMKEDDFNQGVFSDPIQLIQGKVAGLSIVRPNGGDPNSGFEVLLRGSSSVKGSLQPLIVVDGIPGGSLESLAPQDIESIDILKDGSAAAIYGTRGTNGVILVTTKKGQKGQMQVEFSSRFFTERLLNKIEVLSADEYRAVKEEWSQSDDERKANKTANMIDYGSSTDWFDAITRDPFSHNQHLSLSGGSENTSYRLSFDYLSHEGILLNNSRKEYKVSLNMQQLALKDRLMFNTQLGMTNSNYHPVDYNAVRQCIKRNPTMPVYNTDGSVYEVPGWQNDNPVGILTERSDDKKISRYFVNLGADLNITEELKIGVLTGLHIVDSLGGYYQPSYSFPQETAGTYGRAQREVYAKSITTFESVIEWKKHLTNHNINIIGGYSYQDFIYEGFEASNTNFVTDEIEYNNLGLGTYLTEGSATMDSDKKQSRLIAFFARGAYNFRGRYFISASIRREGSSKFGANNKWGTFPAVSVAWDISNEDFMSAIELQMLKLRLGYGVTGNEGLDDPYVPLIRYGYEGRFYYEGAYVQGFGPVNDTSDGRINVADRDVIGNGIPDLFMGLSTTVQYGNWDVTIMCRGMFGQQIINAKRIWYDNPSFIPENVMKTALDEDVWDSPDFSSYYVEDADFVKVDNITIGYRLPVKNLGWITSARIYLTGTNLFVITGYTGVDPEVSIRGLEPGNDNRFDYPSTRTFMVDFNVKF
jgi:TonB-linked SusC/RagA family outer membrane protein